MSDQATEQSVEDRFVAILRSERGEAPQQSQEEPATEPQEEPDQEEQPEADSEPDQVEQVTKYRFKVKSDEGTDEEVEMTPEEMQKGVMLERDYRRKTTELARAKEQAETDIRTRIEAERQQYLQNLDLVQKAFIKTIAPEFEGLDMSRLADEDPAQYVKVSNRMNQVQQVLSAIQQEQARAAEEARTAQQQAMQKAVKEARETLQREIPTWSDQLYEDVLKSTMTHYGFKADEVNGVVDPRIVKLMHDASEFQKLKGSKSLVDKKVSQAPKVLKPSQGTNLKDDKTAKVRQNLKRSGSIEDAADYFKTLLKR